MSVEWLVCERSLSGRFAAFMPGVGLASCNSKRREAITIFTAEL